MLNLDEEKKIAELKSICKELKIQAPMDIFITMKVEKQKEVLFEDVQRGHSWTRNYYNLIFSSVTSCAGTAAATFGAGHMTMKIENGTIHEGNFWNTGVYSDAYTGDAGLLNTKADAIFGIVVGTGTGAFSIEDYCLNTKIEHGNSAGQLFYQPMVKPPVVLPVYTSGTKIWTATVSRVFNNNSGGTIVVGETGLMMRVISFETNTKIQVERNVLSPTVSVGDGAQLTVTYTFSSDFSSVD